MYQSKKENFIILVLSGPSGTGKTTLCDRLLNYNKSNIQKIITTTTRSKRKNEMDGKDYFFISKNIFEQKIQNNEFYEYKFINNNYYGSYKTEIIKKINMNSDLIFSIDVEGFLCIKKLFKSNLIKNKKLISIFIITSSMDELKCRLNKRGDNLIDIERRLNIAKQEITYKKLFDYCLLSKTKDQDFNFLLQIYNHYKSF